MPSANIFMEVEAAIYSRLTGGSALMALIPGGVFPDHASEGQVAPYLVFRFVSGREDDSAGSETDILTYDVVVHDDADYMDGATAAVAEAHALLHNYRVATTTYNLTFRRTTRIEFRAPDGWWNVGGSYEVHAAHK